MEHINLRYLGPVIHITNITTLRDGGTFVIMTSNKYEDDLHINHKTFEVYDGYPLTTDNLITDKDFKEYLSFRIQRYLENVEQSLNQNKELLANFIGTETDAQLLERHGWTIECESPLEIRHDDSSFVSGNVAKSLIKSLKANNKENLFGK